MSSEQRQRDYARLLDSLDDRYHHQLLIDLQAHEPALLAFDSWGEAIRFMRRGSSSDPAKDPLLVSLVRAFREAADQRVLNILLAIFWPALLSIHRRTRHWGPADDRTVDDGNARDDGDVHWVNTQMAFVETIIGLDLDQRSTRLVQRVFGDTYSGLYRAYLHEWRRPEVPLELPDPWEPDAGDDPDERDVATWDPAITAFEDREESAAQIAWLRDHVTTGRLREDEMFIVIGTRLYGQSLAEYAEAVGMDYETAKKRRQRAERKIGGWPEDS